MPEELHSSILFCQKGDSHRLMRQLLNALAAKQLLDVEQQHVKERLPLDLVRLKSDYPPKNTISILSMPSRLNPSIDPKNYRTAVIYQTPVDLIVSNYYYATAKPADPKNPASDWDVIDPSRNDNDLHSYAENRISCWRQAYYLDLIDYIESHNLSDIFVISFSALTKSLNEYTQKLSDFLGLKTQIDPLLLDKISQQFKPTDYSAEVSSALLTKIKSEFKEPLEWFMEREKYCLAGLQSAATSVSLKATDGEMKVVESSTPPQDDAPAERLNEGALKILKTVASDVSGVHRDSLIKILPEDNELSDLYFSALYPADMTPERLRRAALLYLELNHYLLNKGYFISDCPADSFLQGPNAKLCWAKLPDITTTDKESLNLLKTAFQFKRYFLRPIYLYSEKPALASLIRQALKTDGITDEFMAAISPSYTLLQHDKLNMQDIRSWLNSLSLETSGFSRSLSDPGLYEEIKALCAEFDIKLLTLADNSENASGFSLEFARKGIAVTLVQSNVYLQDTFLKELVPYNENLPLSLVIRQFPWLSHDLVPQPDTAIVIMAEESGLLDTRNLMLLSRTSSENLILAVKDEIHGHIASQMQKYFLTVDVKDLHNNRYKIITCRRKGE
ncbi:MAG: hypothetical protein D6719_09760 [Candidatus Dadabacteria bacterium]|nr:MAG: hypothetical protein D6719_09760 [Candidatus Dadabacteria bacterium]